MNALIVKTLAGSAAALAFCVALVPGAASAGQLYSRYDHQQLRIDRGVADGQLTRREYISDEDRLDRVNAAREADLRRNGGFLTARERYNLSERFNNNSHDIYFTKHNLRHQPGAATI